MTLSMTQAKKLRRGDYVFTRTTRPNGSIRVTKWKVLSEDATIKLDPTRVQVRLIHESTSGKLTQNNLDEFYPSFRDAYEDNES